MDTDTNPATPPANDPVQTDGKDANPPAATPPADDQGAATKGEKTVTLKEADYKNLVSQRDRNANEASANQEFMLTLAKEREIDSFLEKNKEKFPDVTRQDLMYLDDPDQLEEAAVQMQRRLEDHVQQKLLDVQNTTAPVLSPEERKQRLAKLKKDGAPDAFEQMVEIRSTAS